jgi:uncharacterized HhH-GPD family protein
MATTKTKPAPAPKAKTAKPKAPKALWLTDDEEACRLLASDPNALLIGFILDQQVTVQKAFRGPLDIRERVGTIEPAKLAKMSPAKLERAFAEKPAIHRFPSANAKRVQEAMRIVTEQYDGDASRIWSEAKDTKDLEKRLLALPGFGKGKAFAMTTVLAGQLGYPFTGWKSKVAKYGCLGDVDSPEALQAYQAKKRAAKAKARAAAAKADGGA